MRCGRPRRRYGVAIDHKFASNLYSGIEVSKRELKIPVVSVENVIEEDWDEQLYRVYLTWTPLPHLAVSAAYQFDRFDNEDEIEPIPDTRTHLAPVSLRYFHPSGLFSRLGATYVSQTADLVEAEERDGEFVVTEDSRDDQFMLVGASLGYRLPKRYGTIEMGVENIFNEDFDFQGLVARTTTETDILPFIPERVVTAKIILVF
jgi:outer membrane receptor for ferrienterochelin and colicin